VERAPRGHALRLEQAHQFLPHERRRVDVVGAAPQRANSATEVSSDRAQAAARQIGQEAPRNVTRADDVEREEVAAQRAKERLLESSEMDDRRRGLLREARGLVAQRAPREVSVDSGPHHVLRDACDPRDGRRNLLAIWQRDQARMRVRDCVADLGPADFKEMPSGRGGRGLAVDHQHLHLRERLGHWLTARVSVSYSLYLRSWKLARSRLTAIGKSPTKLVVDVQLASRAASRRFQRADE